MADDPPFDLIDYAAEEWADHSCPVCAKNPHLRPACGFYTARRAWEAEHGPLLEFDAVTPTSLPDQPFDPADL